MEIDQARKRRVLEPTESSQIYERTERRTPPVGPKLYSDSEGVSLEINTQTDVSHLTTTPTGIESYNLDLPSKLATSLLHSCQFLASFLPRRGIVLRLISSGSPWEVI